MTNRGHAQNHRLVLKLFGVRVFNGLNIGIIPGNDLGFVWTFSKSHLCRLCPPSLNHADSSSSRATPKRTVIHVAKVMKRSIFRDFGDLWNGPQPCANPYSSKKRRERVALWHSLPGEQFLGVNLTVKFNKTVLLTPNFLEHACQRRRNA